MRTLSHTPLALLTTLLVACHDPTSLSAKEQTHRARWVAHGITSYQYDYRVTGFFINYAGHRVRVQVRAGQVQAATDLDAGQPFPNALTTWPTIDQLFDRVESAAANGTLLAVRYDPTYDYPAEIDIDGPPDASGSVYASNLVPLP